MKSFPQRLSQPETRTRAICFFVLTVLQTLFGPMDVYVFPNAVTVGLDEVVLIKLFLSVWIGIAALWGLMILPSVREAMFTLPALAISLLLGLTVLGATSGINSASIPSSIINFVNLIFVASSLSVLGLRAFSLAVIGGTFLTATFGLYWYYFYPLYGVFGEPIENGEFLYRLGGLAHPNSIARTALIGTLLSLYLFRTKETTWLQTTILLLFFGWNIILAKSRTAVVAGFVGCCVLYSDKIRSRAGFAAAVCVGILIVAGLFAMFAIGKEDRLIDKLVNVVSKSGNVEELMSGTGRTAIWAEAARKIAQRPIVGYGLNSGPMLLTEFSAATHNASLHATLSGGIFAGLLMLGLQLWVGWNALQNTNLIIRALCTFLSISCLAEDTVLETFPGPCTLMWFVCCIYPTMSQLSDQSIYLLDDVEDLDDLTEDSSLPTYH